MSPLSLSSPDLAFARHASLIAGRTSSHAIGARLPRSVWWIATAVLALHLLVWIVTPVRLADFTDTSPDREAIQIMLIAPPAPRNSSLKAPAVAEPQRSKRNASATPTVPEPPQHLTSPAAKPSEPRAPPASKLNAPPLDWRADIARDAASQSTSKASSPVASTERAITDQSQRTAPPGTPSAQGNVAQRAFEREFGSGQASVSGPKATREGGNPLGTTECIEMNGKRVCTRQRNLASDMDPFMKRERVFSPVMR